ncbi:MAG: MFS transporter [Chloroflexi bacterium]|nr:MFS transporter [Chloroflexota bacterium]
MKSWKPYHTVWLVLGLTWVTNYLVRVGLSPALVPIKEEFGLSHSEAGLLATAFFYSYTAMQIPAGFIGDRIGRKIVILISCLGWAASSLLLGFASSVKELFALRLSMGAAEGSLFGNDRPVISAYTPKDKMGMGQGLSFTGLGTGMGFGILLAGFIAERMGWRWIFIIFSIAAFFAAFLVWRVIKEPPRLDAERTPVSLSSLLTNRDMWCLYVGGISSVYCLWVLGTWAPTIIVETTNTELGLSSVYSSVLGFAAIPGLFIMGALSDVMVRKGLGRKTLGGLGFLGQAITIAFLGFAIQERYELWILTVTIFAAGFFTWGAWGPIYALYADLVPLQILGTAYGIGNFVNFFGSLIAPWASGAIRDYTGSFAWACYVAAIFTAAFSLVIFAISPAFRLGPEIRILDRQAAKALKLSSDIS